MDAENKKYNQMENVLTKINKDYISLPAQEEKRNNKILEQATSRIIALMKEKDALFRNMYERKFYGGSYYDGIKVGKPEEYDLDYVLNLPLIIEPALEAAKDKPGFVHVRIKEYTKLLKRDEASRFEKLDTLMDKQNYLSTFKVLQWIERTITLALNELEKVPDKGWKLDIKLDEQQNILIYATLSKAHPAFTLKLKDADGAINLDIDLVPCFQFGKEQWLNKNDGYRPNPIPRKDKFLVVPKKPHGMDESPILERYWRLSFQEQERELIKGHHFKSMKPTIKMLKKIRDKQNHVKIASYYIKTIFLWQVEREPLEFWEKPWSYVFMMMLRKYAEMIQQKCIPYYWNKNHNLIGHIKEVTIIAIGNTLRNLIEDIEKNLDIDPFVAAKYIIGQDQLEAIRCEVNLGKKHLRKLKINQSLSAPHSPPSVVESDSSQSEISEDEKVKKLVLNPEFLQEMTEVIAKHLHLRWRDAGNRQNETSDLLVVSNESKPPENEILQSLDGVHVKMDKMAGMISELTNQCDLLTDKVSNLESGLSDLQQENSRLRSELKRANAGGERRRGEGSYLDDVFFGINRLGCERLLEK